MQPTWTNYAYILASVLFVFGLKMLSSARTARQGNWVSAVGMLVAVLATLVHAGMSYQWILLGVGVGAAIGYVSAMRVKMTAMPEMVALFNGSGGLASLLVGWAEYHTTPGMHAGVAVPTALAVLIGGITFTGSIVAYAKLAEKLPGKPLLFRGQNWMNLGLLLLSVVLLVSFAWNPPGTYWILGLLIGLSLVLGVLAVIPIGGADMPVVISLLNSYSGVAACAAGFVILNDVLIVAGSLVGASGLILTKIMCKAMNRSLANVLFSGFGSTAAASSGSAVQGEAKPISAEDCYHLLEAARSVLFVPGYGMAVAQAQHVVCELGELLLANGAEVRYAIHPVAGRMPGHMNVLLAEASVPYELLVEPDDVNPGMRTVDLAVVIGANDVVNPAAREDASSPIYGMPIINVDQAKTCIVLKRSLKPGFAGVENALFFCENTRMLFGDAKSSLQAVIAQFKD
ncbi:MAG: NAD(P)(+) transhydrogenase (Re/Si-specific) subunit beta [Verrucomicrobia bacterium]|nr:NAD(P)(+) transhydrogenase (Re/Si-specific) subunit beta [Verrucomicrobiota bacterium]